MSSLFMLIDILLTSLSMFTHRNAPRSVLQELHRRIRLAHAKRPPRQRLSPRQLIGSYPRWDLASRYPVRQ